MSKRFYAIATGNNQANLPPILSLAERGDVVIWLETPRARSEQWANGANLVLQGRRIDFRSVPVSDADVLSPDRLQARLEQDIADRMDQVVFVLNGGQKHALLGIDRLARGRFHMVYSDLKPAQLYVLDPDSSAFHVEPLKNCVTFEEWLLANGLQLMADDRHEVIWPSIPGSLAPDGLAAFRADQHFARLLFRVFDRVCREGGVARTTDLPCVQARIRSDPSAAGHFAGIVRESMRRAAPRLAAVRRESVADRLADTHGHLFTTSESFFRKQIQREIAGAREMLLTPEEEGILRQEGWIRRPIAGGRLTPAALQPSGPWFERAVACRIAEFLRANPALAAPVVSACQGVNVARPRQPEAQFAEYDVVLFLQNATVLAIECKMARPGEKDHFARLAKLQQTGGPAVSLIFCSPIFTGLATEPEFRRHHELHATILDLCQLNPNFKFLAYTQNDQPQRYQAEDTWYEVEPFEQGLAKILRPYCMSPAGSVV